MTSRQDTSTTRSTGAHRKHRAPAGRDRERDSERDSERVRDRARRAQRRPHGTLPIQPPAHYEPYLDGLFTYCLSKLYEHDTAAAALGEALALADRQRARLRDAERRRAWLYALARWVCLRRLAAGAPSTPCAVHAATEPRRAELAALTWPEAVGTTPEQREALELTVRHQLPAEDVARVLGLDADPAKVLLARAACEVERTRTALAVADTGRCAAVARLADRTTLLVGTAPRAELVRHVDECEVCRRTAERVVAGDPWPGATAGAVLALVEAPRPATYAALLHAMEAGVGRARDATPRFDPHGFPLDLKDRTVSRAELRHRAMTSAVVAAVVAAPVLALWAAYRAAPLGDEASSSGHRAATSEQDGLDGVSYQKAGTGRPSSRPRAAAPDTAAPGAPSTTVVVSAAPPPAASANGAATGGYLLVTARTARGGTAVTLTAGGGAPVHWTASTAAYWLQLSATSGVLRPAESITLMITADRALQPDASWAADITFASAGATVTLLGAPGRSAPPPPAPAAAPPPLSSLTPAPTPSKPPPTQSPAPAPT